MDSNNIKITPRWSKSKEQIWAERFEQLSETPKVVRFYRQKWFAYTAAAVVLFAVVLPVAAYIYKTKFAAQSEATIAPAKDVDIAVPALSDKFDFTDTPLEEVISQIETQYGIKVIRPANMDLYYTGTFSRTLPADDVLKIVGEPFGIKLKIDH